MTSGPRYRRAPSALWRWSGDDVLVRLAHEERTHELNAAAAAVWGAMRRSTTVAVATEAVAAGYGVQPSALAADVEACMRSLTRLGVVEEVPPDSVG